MAPPHGSHPTLPKFPPATVITAAVIVGVAVLATVLMLACSRPWLGISFRPHPDGPGVVATAAGSTMPADSVVTRISGGGLSQPLETLDLTLEPDGSMGDYATYDRFLARQTVLARIQDALEITLTSADGANHVFSPSAAGRPLVTLPAVFWVQLVVGLVAWLVSAAVFAFRPGETSARYLLLSGFSTLLFSPAAAVYTTRELAMDGTLFRWASDLNFFGGSLFTASFVAMLLHYPRKIAPTWVGVSVVALYIGWFALQQCGAFESMTFARRFLVVVGVIVTFALAGVHWFLTRRDPVARAALQWFLLSWMVGTCSFCLFILLPQLFGVDTSPLQGYAFLLFLLVYGGLAFGILRYRLFDLGIWWRRAAVWSIGILLLVLFDLFFLFGLHLSSGMSLSLTLALCGIVWLPLRTWVWHRFAGRRSPDQGEWFGRVIDVALCPCRENRNELWKNVIAGIFDPLQLMPVTDAAPREVALGHDGLSLELPAIGAIDALRLEFANGGRRLFTPADVRLAGEFVTVLSHAMESRSSYEKGVTEERSRIARDIHDNIGAHLLAALHSSDPASKDVKIRETIADLRDVINNIASGNQSIDETFAELRFETDERLASAGIRLDWSNDGGDRPLPGTDVIHTLRSIIREAVSNVIRHSGASRARLTLRFSDDSVALQIEDDGCGFDSSHDDAGNGLVNMSSRAGRVGGSLKITALTPGTRIAVTLPLTPAPPSR